MFGIVFAMLNRSACSEPPRAATSRAERMNPLAREKTVPTAITALLARTRSRSSSGRSSSNALIDRSRPGRRADPAEQPDQDGPEEQGDAGPEDQPDPPADPVGPDRQRVRGPQRRAFGVRQQQRGVADADRTR